MTDYFDGAEFEQDPAAQGYFADEEAIQVRSYPLANPDDPPAYLTPADAAKSLRGPDFMGAPGYIAIVQGQVYLVAALLIVQLFLITVALFELLSGKRSILWWIAGASLLAFLLALLVTLWPRRRITRG